MSGLIYRDIITQIRRSFLGNIIPDILFFFMFLVLLGKYSFSPLTIVLLYLPTQTSIIPITLKEADSSLFQKRTGPLQISFLLPVSALRHRGYDPFSGAAFPYIQDLQSCSLSGDLCRRPSDRFIYDAGQCDGIFCWKYQYFYNLLYRFCFTGSRRLCPVSFSGYRSPGSAHSSPSSSMGDCSGDRGCYRVHLLQCLYESLCQKLPLRKEKPSLHHKKTAAPLPFQDVVQRCFYAKHFFIKVSAILQTSSVQNSAPPWSAPRIRYR